MAEQVRVHTLPDAGELRHGADHLSQAGAAKRIKVAGRTASGCEKEVVSGRMVRSRRTDVALQALGQSRCDGHKSIALCLARDVKVVPAVAVDKIVWPQTDELAEPNAGISEDGDD